MSKPPVSFEGKPEQAPRAHGGARAPEAPPAQKQFGLTLMAQLREGTTDEVRRLLCEIGANMKLPAPTPGTADIRFNTLTTTHFCRFVVIPGDPSHACPASLAFESNYDGALDAHLDELIAAGEPALKSLYSLCADWTDPQDLKAYLEARSIGNAAFYSSHGGLSQRWIQNDIRVRDAIEGYLLQEQKKPGWPPEPAALRAGIQEHLKDIPDLFTGPLDRDLPSELGMIKWLFLGVPLLPLVLAALPFLRYKEVKDRSDPLERYFPISKLATLEDQTVQNQLTHLVPIKPGWLRLQALRLVLFSINQLAYYVLNKGQLGGIPSIHFARWIIIDGGKRLLFFSNYDGSWENYLGDFIDKAATGLTGVWSNTVGFPEAKLLLFEGATHEEQFKQWTRAHQIPTQVWYQAYPSVTVENVLQNDQIRQQVSGSLTGDALTDWLAKL
ncbi:MAG: hypothetical protein ABJE95_05300 [Byssovorax sp.]